MGPEYDKCDKIAPVCCWLEDGKKKCKYYGKNVLPKDWPDWPGLIDTATPSGENKIEQIFKFYLPGAIRGCCFQDTNRENAGEKKLCNCDECKVVFACHKTLVGYLNEFIDPNDPRMPQSNPCGKSWTYDCKKMTWTDKEGKPPEVKNAPTR